ncbi:MAG: mechanosensitive ion channel family protein [Victivallaceae bacterium]|nr:mechanosensitive ion channel family protein [Victivallaceae bacterium]
MLKKYFMLMLSAFMLCSMGFSADDAATVSSPPMKVTVSVEGKQYELQFKNSAVESVVPGTEPEGTVIEDVSRLNEELYGAWDVVVEWWDLEKINLLVLVGGIFVTLLVAALVGWLFKVIVMKMFAKKTENKIDDMLGEAVEPAIRSFVIVLGITLSAMPILLDFPPMVFNVIIRIALAGLATTVAWGLFRLIAVFDYALHALSQKTTNNLDDLIVNLIRKTLKITLITIAVLFIGQSILGLNITTLLAGAGVLGLGIAFAAKDTISNFFGSLMIILDKPFKVGDRIVVDGVDGVVEHVGFRSTRLRTLPGHLVTVPNSKMADNAIENIDARPYIKLVSNLTLVYETPVEKVERAVEVLHEILDNHEGLNEEKPPMIGFNAFNDWSLNIVVIVWYHPGDWVKAQTWNHYNNLEILKRFNAEGLEFAFPTNTTYLAGDPTRELVIEQKK